MPGCFKVSFASTIVKYVIGPKKLANCLCHPYYLLQYLGLVMRLNDHRDDHANLHLKNFSTYILVEKQEPLNSEEEDILPSFHRPLEDAPLTSYVPLLENYSTLLPKFKLRVAMENAGQHPHRHPKSPRPASRANHGHVTNKSPSRKVKRAKTKTPKDSR